MRELQAGNADAFAVVFDRYHRLVLVTALRTLHDFGEAEDMTQTVFLEIYRTADDSTPPEEHSRCGCCNRLQQEHQPSKLLGCEAVLQTRANRRCLRHETVWNLLQQPASQEFAR